MAKTGALFSEGDAGRISRVVKKVEAQGTGEGGKRPRRLAGIAAFLWAKLISGFDGGADNTVKANPCSDAGGNNVVTDVEMVLYVELPVTGAPDRSCFAAGDVVAYMPYLFRDVDGNETAQGFLVDPTRAAGVPAGTSTGQVAFWDHTDAVWTLTAEPGSPSTKDYALVFDHSAAHGAKLKWAELGAFVCP